MVDFRINMFVYHENYHTIRNYHTIYARQLTLRNTIIILKLEKISARKRERDIEVIIIFLNKKKKLFAFNINFRTFNICTFSVSSDYIILYLSYGTLYKINTDMRDFKTDQLICD